MFFKILNGPTITGFTGIVFPVNNCINQKNLIPVTKERSLAIAEDFLWGCPTFKYDGIHDSVRLSIIDAVIDDVWNEMQQRSL